MNMYAARYSLCFFTASHALSTQSTQFVCRDEKGCSGVCHHEVRRGVVVIAINSPHFLPRLTVASFPKRKEGRRSLFGFDEESLPPSLPFKVSIG